MENGIKRLEELGFSRYEAKAYIALLRRSPQNGYELAKSSGVPRANIYAVLHKLEARSAVLRLDTSSGIRFAPVPISELIERQEVRFRELLETTRKSLDQVVSEPQYEYVWNIRGYPALLEHVRSLVQQTREQLLIALLPTESALLGNSLSELEARGVEIITLCLLPCPAETCGTCRGKIYRYAIVPAQLNRWLLAVADHVEVLASEIGPGEDALSIRTRQPLFVHLAQWNIRNSIALAALVEDLGEHLPDLLQANTKKILDEITGKGAGESWLTQFRSTRSARQGKEDSG